MLCAKRLEIQRAKTNFNRCSHPPFICEKMCKKEANRPRGLIFRLKVHKFIWFLSRAFNSVLSHFYYGFPQVKVKMATKEAEGIKGAKSYFHLEIATRRRVEGQEKKLDFQTLQSLVWRMIKKKSWYQRTKSVHFLNVLIPSLQGLTSLSMVDRQGKLTC